MNETFVSEKQISPVISSVRVTSLDIPTLTKTLTEALIKAGYYLEFNLTESYSRKLGFDEQTTVILSSETEAFPTAHYEFTLSEDKESILFYRICTHDPQMTEYTIPFDRLELFPEMDVRSPLVKIVSEMDEEDETFWLFTDLMTAVMEFYIERLCNLPAHTLDDDRNHISSKENVVNLFNTKL